MLGDDRGGRRLVPPQSISGHAIRDRLHLVRSEALELRTPSSSRTPPQDLQAHNCIRLRFPSGAFLPWRSSIEGKTLELDVNGSLIANDADLLVHVALNGNAVALLRQRSTGRPAIHFVAFEFVSQWFRLTSWHGRSFAVLR